ncbi:hypothetical protein AMECASPLE_013501 [Ameca splendens]|uniref:Uncharacterized protein n=1 Tax=Ameca splendens TaxID=208324 RepID=A0ABV0ZB49_9TELE
MEKNIKETVALTESQNPLTRQAESLSDYNHHLLQVAENVFVWPKEMEITGLNATAWGLGAGEWTVTQLAKHI